MSHVVEVGVIPGMRTEHSEPVGRQLREAGQSIDDLVGEALRYRSGAQFAELIRFVADFRQLAPFNAMLVHVQQPGSTYVATAQRWRTEHGRALLPGARPLVVLQSFGPVAFVYDVSDTTPLPGGAPLPPEVAHPFDCLISAAASALSTLTVNAIEDGVCVTYVDRGTQRAGSIEPAEGGQAQLLPARRGRPAPADPWQPVLYEMKVNGRLDDSARYATVLHELAHLYCGHLGTPNEKGWPSRRLGDEATREVEAESAAFIAARRLDEHAQFPPYLDQYVGPDGQLPKISLERVLKVAGDLEKMSQRRLPPRGQRRR